MKYPSVFLTLLVVWIVVDSIALSVADKNLTLNLYFAAIIFSTVLFLIGFWRNK